MSRHSTSPLSGSEAPKKPSLPLRPRLDGKAPRATSIPSDKPTPRGQTSPPVANLFKNETHSDDLLNSGEIQLSPEKTSASCFKIVSVSDQPRGPDDSGDVEEESASKEEAPQPAPSLIPPAATPNLRTQTNLPTTATPLPNQPKFQVVKVVSKDPYKRGRFRCREFNDPPSTAAGSVSRAQHASEPPADQQGHVAPASAFVGKAGTTAAPHQMHHVQSVPAVPQSPPVNTPSAQPPNTPVLSQTQHASAPIPVPTPAVAKPSVDPAVRNRSVHSPSVPSPLAADPGGDPALSAASSPVTTTKDTAPVSTASGDPPPIAAHVSEPSAGYSQSPRWSISAASGHGTLGTPLVPLNITGVPSQTLQLADLFMSPTGAQIVPFSEPVSLPTTSGNSDSTGADVVAIDNKIEQAMDLVKTHLMYAVRDEVEHLKQRIDRLELENKILKDAASPETLKRIQQSVSSAAVPGAPASITMTSAKGVAPQTSLPPSTPSNAQQ